MAESVLIPQKRLEALTPTPLTLNNDQAPPGGAWSIKRDGRTSFIDFMCRVWL